MLVSYDLEKAFDRVEWSVLFDIMEKFEFPQEYITMIKNLFKGLTSYTINCGYTSEEIKISRGLMQGSPVSSSLFLLTAEVLAQMIREDTDIQGVEIPGQIHKKLGQYADDLWALIRNSQINFTNLM